MTLPNYIKEPVEKAEEEKKKPSYYPYGPNQEGVEKPQEIVRPTFNIPENMKMYHDTEVEAGLPEQEGYKVLPDNWGYAMSRQFGAPGSGYFAEDPKRLARYHYFLQTAPEGWQPPPWLDRDQYEQAFSFMSQTYGDDWTQWEALEPEDPTNLLLSSLYDPPLDFRFPNEINSEDELLKYLNNLYVTDKGIITKDQYAKQQAELLRQQSEISPFMQEGTWQEMEKWQQAALSIFSPQPMQGRPEWSRLTAAGFQGLQAGVAGLAIGATAGTVAGVPGMAIGAALGLIIGGAAGYQAYTGVEIPGINNLLTLMDLGAITAERLIGIAAQLSDDDSKEVLQNIFDIYFKDGKLNVWGPAGQAGEFVYEASGVGTKALNIMSGGAQTIENVLNGLGANVELSSGMKADYAAGQIWALERAIVEPFQLQEGMLGGESLDEIRSRLISGAQFEDIYNDYISQYGFSGTVGDFVAQSVLDPLNFIPGMQGEIIGKIANKVDNPGIRARLTQAVYMNKGNILSDALPIGTKWVAKIFDKNAKQSGGAFDIMRTYKNLIRQGGLAEGFLPTKTVPDFVALNLTNPDLFADSGKQFRNVWDNNLTPMAEGKGAMVNMDGVKADFTTYVETQLQNAGVDIENADVRRMIQDAVDGVDGVVTDVAINNYGKSDIEFANNLQKAFTEYFDENIGSMKWGETTKEIKYYPERNAWERKFAGLTDESTFAELQPGNKPKNWFQKLAALDVESQAITHMQMLFTNVAGILTMADGDVAQQLSLLKQMAGIDPTMVGDVAASMIESPATKTTAPVIKAFVETGLLDEMYTVWLTTSEPRAIFNMIAKELGLETGKLLKMIEDEPNAVIQMITNSESGKLGDFKQAIETGLLNGEKLKSDYEPFWGTKQLPIDGNMFTAQLLMNLSDFSDKFMVDYYGIKAKPVINRLSSVLKSLQSLAVLGFNPLYAVYNYVNNVASRAAQGVFGFHSPKQIQRFWTKFGVKPAMLDVGVGLAGMPDGTHMGGQAIAAAMDADDFIGKMRKATTKANKLGVFSRMAAQIEVMESRQATTIGTEQAWHKLWQPGVGFKKLDPKVEAALNNLTPGMTQFIYGIARSGLNMDEITSKLYTRSKFMGVDSIIDRAVNKVFTNSPDVAHDFISKSGIRNMFKELLGDNPTVDDINAAFEYVNAKSEAIVEQAFSNDVVARSEDARNRVASEGMSAIMPLWGEMWAAFTSRRLQDIIENTKIANVADAYRGVKDWLGARNVWQQHLNATERRWNRTHTMMYNTAKGIMDAVNVTDPAAAAYVNIFKDWMDGWDKFYAEKNVELRKFFSKNLKGKERNAAYKTMQEKVAALYDQHTTTEQQQLKAMFDHLGKVYETTSHRPGAEVAAWGENVVKAWDKANSAVSEFRTGLRNTELSVPEVRQAFEIFNTETFKPMIMEQRNAIMEGAAQLSRMVKPETGEIGYLPKYPLLTEGGGEPGGQTTYINEAGGTVRPGPRDRFVDAYSLRKEINNQAERMAGLTVTDKQRNMVAAMISEVYPNVEERHAVQRFLFDTNSISMAKPEKVRAALNLFVALDEQGNTVFTIPENVRAALAQALEAAREEAGQMTIDSRPADTASAEETAKQNKQEVSKEADNTAEQQRRYADQINNRADFKRSLMEAGYKREEVNAITFLVEQRAKKLGVEANEYIKKTFAAILSGDMIDKQFDDFIKGLQQADKKVRGETNFLEDGRAIIRLYQSKDVSTMVNEVGHIFRRELDANDLEIVAEWMGYKNADELLVYQKAFYGGEADGIISYIYSTREEKFAQGFERYFKDELYLDVAPPAIVKVFQKFAQWLRDIYTYVFAGVEKDALPKIEISDAMKDVYNRLFFQDDMIQSRASLSDKLKHMPTGMTTEALGVNTKSKYNMQFKVVDLFDLITSHTTAFEKNSLFPQELQARFRELVSNRSTVIEIASKLNPDELLLDTKLVEAGPMIIGPDMVVESGNGRTLALAIASRDYPDNYRAYVDALKAKVADYGIDPASIEGIENPVLVRQRMDDVDRIAFADDANGQRTADYSTLEAAYSDAKFWDKNLLSEMKVYATTDIDSLLISANNEGITQGFLDNVPQNEKGKYIASDGSWSDAGIDKMKASLLARVFKGDKGKALVTYFAEKSKSDDIAANLKSSTENVLGEIAKVEGMIESDRLLSEMSIADDVSSVVFAYLNMKRKYGTFDNFLKTWENQATIFGDAYADLGLIDPGDSPDIADYKKDIFYLYAENARRVKPQTQLWKIYTQKLLSEPQYMVGQMDMFGTKPTPKSELIRMTIQEMVDSGMIDPFREYTPSQTSLEDIQQSLAQSQVAKPEGVSELESIYIDKALQTSAYDDKSIPFMEWEPPDGYPYSYYSPNKPVNGTSLKLDGDYKVSDKGNFVFTKEPIAIDVILKNQLTPHSTISRGELLKSYGLKKYGTNDYFIFGNKETKEGVIVTHSTYGDNWRQTYFDKWGFTGHMERGDLVNTLAQANYYKMRSLSPQSVEWFNEVTKPWTMKWEDAKSLYQSRVVTETPQGGTPIPQYDGMLKDEIFSETLTPLLDQMQEIALSDMEKGSAFSLSDLPEDVNAEVQAWLSQMPQDMAATKLTSMRHGEQMRNRALLNYRERRGIDDYMNMVFPYQFWFTRTMGEWAKRMIEKPAWIAAYARLRRHQKRMEQEGIPTRLKGKMRIPAPWLPDWMGDGIYIDPFKQLFPFAQFTTPFEMTAQLGNNVEYAAIREVQNMVGETITAKQAEQIIAEKNSPQWNEALSRAQAQLEQGGELNAMNIASMMMSPAMWWTYPYHILNGTPEQLYPLPGTRTGQALREFGGPLGVIGNIMALPEETIRKKFNLSSYGEWGDYYVDRTLANMAAEGVVSTDDALIAMIERQGPAYEQAFDRVQKEMALKIPGSQTGLALQEGKYGGILYTLPTTLFPAGLLPEGELKQRNLKTIYNKAWDDYKNGNPQAINNFFDQHPEYQARLALFDEPEERLKQFLINEIWDSYTNLDDKNKPLVIDQLGANFERMFLDKETRDYESIDAETLTHWARQLGGKTPGSESSPLYLQEGLKLYKPEVLKEVEEYNTLRDQNFPNYKFLQDTYWSLPKDARPDFLDTMPELKNYWDWREEYYEDHPNVEKYQEEQKKRYEDTSTIYTTPAEIAQPTVEEATAEMATQDMPPALMMQITLYHYSGKELSGPAKTMLMEYWKAMGEPGGSFENWVELVKGYILK